MLCPSIAKDCLDLPPPENGAKACDDWAFGRMCSPFCNDRWDFTKPIPPFTIWSCGASGIWLPSMRWPDCTSKYFLFALKQTPRIKLKNWACVTAFEIGVTPITPSKYLTQSYRHTVTLSSDSEYESPFKAVLLSVPWHTRRNSYGET